MKTISDYESKICLYSKYATNMALLPIIDKCSPETWENAYAVIKETMTGLTRGVIKDCDNEYESDMR